LLTVINFSKLQFQIKQPTKWSPFWTRQQRSTGSSTARHAFIRYRSHKFCRHLVSL